jgi:hypothetical protein
MLAFLLGFVTHLVVDSVFHPYVVYYSGTKWVKEPDHKGASIRHFQFEAYLDLHYLQTYKPPHNGLFKRFFHHKEMKISDFIRLVSLLFFGIPDYSWIQIEQPLHMHCSYQSLFMRNWPVNLMKSLNCPGVDFRRSSREFYRSTILTSKFSHSFKNTSPTGDRQAYEHSVADLENEAIRLIHGYFDVFRKHWADSGVLKKLSAMEGPNASTGIPGTTMNDLKYFDLSKPVEELVLGKKFL